MRRLEVSSGDRPSVMLSPLVDMLFVVLIFVLLVSRVDPSALPVDLPGSGGETVEGAQMTVTLSKEGDLSFRGEPVSLEQLTGGLQRAAQDGEEAGVAIAADRTVPLQRVVEVMQAVRDAGISSVQVQTSRSGDQAGEGGSAATPGAAQ